MKEDRSLATGIDPESMREMMEMTRNNVSAQQREYWESRIEDLQNALMDLIALYAEIVGEFRTEIELLRAEVSKLRQEVGE